MAPSEQAQNRVARDQVKKAVASLQKHVRARASQKPSKDLLGEERQFLYVIVALKKVPERVKPTPSSIALKHSMWDPELDQVCLITKDPGHAYASLMQSACPKIHKVMGVSKLAKEYKQFEAKRQLSHQFQLFLADKRVLELLPSMLGKSFFQKKKLPLAIDLKRYINNTSVNKVIELNGQDEASVDAESVMEKEKVEALRAEVDRLLKCSSFYLTQATSHSLRIGHCDMSENELADNIEMALEGISKVLPYGGWLNIQSVHVKTSDSIALPLYNSLPDMENQEAQKKVIEQEMESKKRSAEEMPEGLKENRKMLKSLLKHIKVKAEI